MTTFEVVLSGCKQEDNIYMEKLVVINSSFHFAESGKRSCRIMLDIQYCAI